MPDENSENTNSSKFQKIGLFLALAFYIVSIIIVVFVPKSHEAGNKNVKVITFAHWQLEDGFRKGFDVAIKLFEDYKASQGQKVKVIQTTVPAKGYQQWFMTQMIGGDPADVIELQGSSDVRNQYFIPLSPYIGDINPFNQGTPLEGIPWKNTYIDDMRSGLDQSYAEYYGVGIYMHTLRMYVNMDLLQKATGRRQLPETVTQWLKICEKMREYGRKTGKPIIPIGVRGFDRGTLSQLLIYYNSQLNADLNDTIPEFCSEVSSAEILQALLDGKNPREKLLAAIDVITEIGKYFCDGFPSTDLEQTKFLFFTGNVGFFPEGTWNAFSMINNSPFEVMIIDVPVIGNDHKYSKYFVGRPSEQGTGVGGLFGIPKASKNFELSLEFLRFISSWKINQLTMVEYTKWMAVLKKVKYTGIMEKMQPVQNATREIILFPYSMGSKNPKKLAESMESAIIAGTPNPQGYVRNDFINRIPDIKYEVNELIENEKRNMLNIETMRSSAAMGLNNSNRSIQDTNRFNIRSQMNLENLSARYKGLRNNIILTGILEKMESDK